MFYNLSSGIQFALGIANEIFQVRSKEDAQYNEIVTHRINLTEGSIHNPIKRNKLLVFKNARKKIEVNQDSKQSLAIETF